MRKNKKDSGNDLSKVDAHVIQPEEYEDIPELDEEWFDRANLYIGSKLVRRGRPPSVNPKRQVTLRLDAEVLEAFKAGGKGWQTRINKALREWIEGKS